MPDMDPRDISIVGLSDIIRNAQVNARGHGPLTTFIVMRHPGNILIVDETTINANTSTALGNVYLGPDAIMVDKVILRDAAQVWLYKAITDAGIKVITTR
jgi:hypothetical protein